MASHTFLSVAGVRVVFTVLATWVGLVLTGWSLTFNATEGAVRDSQTATPAELVARLYFVGYTVVTLRNGDYRPGDGVWQLATARATGSGLILITLSITYLVPVASAVALRRQLASDVASLGSSRLRRSWPPAGTNGVRRPLAAQLTRISGPRHQFREGPGQKTWAFTR